ncbi:hypothetical protein B0I35DRAFT_517115 [Stachybotrys elegans]|uniref:Ricin B lectin domain-containing protein n=1 Tax=Stachybotrys elegans TaxID=80388 RepID=A0A8K0WKV9_9HYPO|nr:hypothetical protein B0I35DRAFT_517115 [Stachybotrys elegans]
MADSDPEPNFAPATDIDPNVWYQVSEARVDDYADDDLNSELQVTNADTGALGLWGATGHRWQFQSVDDRPGRYALRSSVTNLRKQLATCFNETEIAEGQTQPCLADSHGGDEQKWDIADWGNETSRLPYYRFINVHNGSDYWLDCHRGNPLFMSPNIDTSVYQPAQRWLLMSMSDIDDGGFSTTFTNKNTSESHLDTHNACMAQYSTMARANAKITRLRWQGLFLVGLL